MARAVADTMSALMVEARGVFGAMLARFPASHVKTGEVGAGDWEHLEVQWSALLRIAEHGRRLARGALAEELDVAVPKHKQGLRDMAEDLGMEVNPFEGYTVLKERVIEELKVRNYRGSR